MTNESKNTDPRVETPTSIYLGWWDGRPKSVDLLAPNPRDIRLEDVAWGLDKLRRFNGQSRIEWTVLEHSLFVLELAKLANLPVETQRDALFHDAAEAFIGDTISPVKRALRAIEPTPLGMRSSWDLLEQVWNVAIDDRFGTSIAIPNENVKRCDELAFRVENHILRGAPIDELEKGFGDSVWKMARRPRAFERFLAAAADLGVPR